MRRRFQKLNDRALFRSGNIRPDAHVMNDDIPLRATVHCRWPNIVTALAVHCPKFFTAELCAGAVWGTN